MNSMLLNSVELRNELRPGWHEDDDVELRLRDNLDGLDGLDWILPQLSGNSPGPRPKYRTK